MRNQLSSFVIVKGIPVIPQFAAVHGFFCGILHNASMANAFISRMVACQETFTDENNMKIEKVTARDRQEQARLTRVITSSTERLDRPPAYENPDPAVELTLKQTIRLIRREDAERRQATEDRQAAHEALVRVQTRLDRNERIARMRLDKSRHLCEQCIRAYIAGNAVFFRNFVPDVYHMSGHDPAYAAQRAVIPDGNVHVPPQNPPQNTHTNP